LAADNFALAKCREPDGFGLSVDLSLELEAVGCASQRLLRNRLPARRRRFA